MTPLATAAKKQPCFSEQDVIGLIRKEQKGMSLREYAAEIGISGAYLSDIYQRRRSPGKKILDYFGITKKKTIVIEYTYERK